MSYDVIQVKYGPKNAHILKSDFGEPRDWETSPCLSNFKIFLVSCL